MKKLLLTILFQSLILLNYSQDVNKAGIIYGDDHAYGLTAPDGWVLDNRSGVNQGLYAVFYRTGESWKNAETVMYTNTASLEDPSHRTLDELINYDVNNFKKDWPDIQYVDADNIVIKENVVARVKHISGKSYGNYESVAYIDAGKTGIMIIMSSRTKSGFDQSLTAFESLVKSYFFIADKVVIEEDKK